MGTNRQFCPAAAPVAINDASLWFPLLSKRPQSCHSWLWFDKYCAGVNTTKRNRTEPHTHTTIARSREQRATSTFTQSCQSVFVAPRRRGPVHKRVHKRVSQPRQLPGLRVSRAIGHDCRIGFLCDRCLRRARRQQTLVQCCECCASSVGGGDFHGGASSDSRSFLQALGRTQGLQRHLSRLQPQVKMISSVAVVLLAAIIGGCSGQTCNFVGDGEKQRRTCACHGPDALSNLMLLRLAFSRCPHLAA